ncbi:MAG: ABC transporter ATP-binding protein/permease [Bdellovibrionaceae bacterium]|nr:ABC transporter ATP-binding protein/permease [Pseudobdellovibrionaceae bacterium]MDW8189626.1 ABC transporter ATP-binding protein [Pseudobdellovibrionaceae bacterium]
MDVQALIRSPLTFYLRRYWKPFTLGIIILIVTDFLDVLSPFFIAQTINAINQKMGVTEILRWTLYFLVTLLGLALTRYLWRVFFAQYNAEASEHLRQHIFRKLLSLDLWYHQKKTTGELVSTLINDIQAYRMAIGNGILVIVDGITITLFTIPLMWWIEPSWLIPTLIFVPFLPFVIRYINNKIHFYFKLQQQELAQLSQFIQETISGIRTIKSFVQESSRLKHFSQLNQKLFEASEKLAPYDAAFGPIMELAVALGSIILVFIAVDDLVTGTVTIGAFVAYQRYILKMVWPMTALGLGFSQFQKGLASFERLKEILLEPVHIRSGPLPLTQFESIEFKNVSYRYHESSNSAITNLSFRLLAGEKVGILGPIGSGKSTLAQLMVRLMDPTTGEVDVNGRSLKEYDLVSLRNKIVLVTQEPILFSLSVRDNLLISKANVSDERIWEALEIVQISQEIQRMSEGLATRVGERGINLSGGQKQRLALARALLSDAELLILDDALSAVDIHTEHLILEQLKKLPLTMMIISHRLQVLKNCEKLMVINNGSLEAFGNRETLMKVSPTFKLLAQLQGTNA